MNRSEHVANVALRDSHDPAHAARMADAIARRDAREAKRQRGETIAKWCTRAVIALAVVILVVTY